VRLAAHPKSAARGSLQYLRNRRNLWTISLCLFLFLAAIRLRSRQANLFASLPCVSARLTSASSTRLSSPKSVESSSPKSVAALPRPKAARCRFYIDSLRPSAPSVRLSSPKSAVKNLPRHDTRIWLIKLLEIAARFDDHPAQPRGLSRLRPGEGTCKGQPGRWCKADEPGKNSSLPKPNIREAVAWTTSRIPSVCSWAGGPR
jgi:hypothetical protein